MTRQDDIANMSPADLAEEISIQYDCFKDAVRERLGDEAYLDLLARARKIRKVRARQAPQ